MHGAHCAWGTIPCPRHTLLFDRVKKANLTRFGREERGASLLGGRGHRVVCSNGQRGWVAFESRWHAGVDLRPGDSAMGEWDLRQPRRSHQARQRCRRHRCGCRPPRTAVAAWDGVLITQCASVWWAACVLCAVGSVSLSRHNISDGTMVRRRRRGAAAAAPAEPDAQRVRRRRVAELSQLWGRIVWLAMWSMRR